MPAQWQEGEGRELLIPIEVSVRLEASLWQAFLDDSLMPCLFAWVACTRGASRPIAWELTSEVATPPTREAGHSVVRFHFRGNVPVEPRLLPPHGGNNNNRWTVALEFAVHPQVQALDAAPWGERSCCSVGDEGEEVYAVSGTVYRLPVGMQAYPLVKGQRRYLTPSDGAEVPLSRRCDHYQNHFVHLGSLEHNVPYVTLRTGPEGVPRQIEKTLPADASWARDAVKRLHDAHQHYLHSHVEKYAHDARHNPIIEGIDFPSERFVEYMLYSPVLPGSLYSPELDADEHVHGKLSSDRACGPGLIGLYSGLGRSGPPDDPAVYEAAIRLELSLRGITEECFHEAASWFFPRYNVAEMSRDRSRHFRASLVAHAALNALTVVGRTTTYTRDVVLKHVEGRGREAEGDLTELVCEGPEPGSRHLSTTLGISCNGDYRTLLGMGAGDCEDFASTALHCAAAVRALRAESELLESAARIIDNYTLYSTSAIMSSARAKQGVASQGAAAGAGADKRGFSPWKRQLDTKETSVSHMTVVALMGDTVPSADWLREDPFGPPKAVILEVTAPLSWAEPRAHSALDEVPEAVQQFVQFLSRQTDGVPIYTPTSPAPKDPGDARAAWHVARDHMLRTNGCMFYLTNGVRQHPRVVELMRDPDRELGEHPEAAAVNPPATYWTTLRTGHRHNRDGSRGWAGVPIPLLMGAWNSREAHGTTPGKVDMSVSGTKHPEGHPANELLERHPMPDPTELLRDYLLLINAQEPAPRLRPLGTELVNDVMFFFRANVDYMSGIPMFLEADLRTGNVEALKEEVQRTLRTKREIEWAGRESPFDAEGASTITPGDERERASPDTIGDAEGLLQNITRDLQQMQRSGGDDDEDDDEDDDGDVYFNTEHDERQMRDQAAGVVDRILEARNRDAIGAPHIVSLFCTLTEAVGFDPRSGSPSVGRGPVTSFFESLRTIEEIAPYLLMWIEFHPIADATQTPADGSTARCPIVPHGALVARIALEPGNLERAVRDVRSLPSNDDGDSDEEEEPGA